MKKIILLTSLLALLKSFAAEPVDYVNPYVGNISHILVPTYPTVQLPNSMMRVVPRRADFSDVQVEGLPLMTYAHRAKNASSLEVFVSDNEAQNSGAPRKYFYDREKITPYSFSVFLEGENVFAKYAPSFRSAIYELDFSEAKNENRNIKIWTNIGTAKIEGAEIHLTESLPKDAKMFTVFRFEAAPIKKLEASDKKSVSFIFDKSLKTIRLKYAVSFVSIEQAKINLEKEITDYDIAKLEVQGRKLWNEKLSKIKVKGGEQNMRIFYTALWRNYERMADFSEYGKYYNAFDKKVHEISGPFYTDDWTWDTYRTSHPLRILIEPKMEAQMLNSYVKMAEASEEKWLPTFPRIIGDPHGMLGHHSIIVFADALSKGLEGVDYKSAYQYAKNTLETATVTVWRRMHKTPLDAFYEEKGYYPSLRAGEAETESYVDSFEKRQSVALTLSISYDDYALSQMAKTLGDTETAIKYEKRSKNYMNLWNAKTKFFHPKDKDGKFIEITDYRYAGGLAFRDFYDENNAYIYRWDLAYNLPELIELMGGKEAVEKNLDELYSTPLGKEKRDFYYLNGPDHSGNIGQFSMGNEPAFHIPFLYNYTGKAWKTQKFARLVCDMWFRDDLMGIPGDEDGGAMSAFVIFTQLGFYPTAPSKPYYDIASPYFTEAVLDLEDGKTLKILAPNTSKENKYIQSVKFNGKEITSPQIPHSLIKDGGVLEFEMSDKPNYNWGK